ncbi:ABC transporter permease [Nonomuraea sp. JJY05]|uniref:ABC transporter permease n=1 Tax=Nonomuraea sp. JJY05 TaxID=3350255 RepID=UPI00373E0BD8
MLDGSHPFWAALVEGVADGTLLTDVWASVLRISMGFLISSALAVPIGVLMGSYKAIEAALEPLIGLIRYMPAVAFIPLTLIWFGTTELQKTCILFIGVFFQQVLMVMDNVKTVPANLIDVARALGFRPLAILVRVVAKSALPGIVDSLRISLGWAWTYLVVAELIGADEGLGFRIQQAQRFVETPKIILGITVIGLLGLAFDLAFKKLHARSFPYLRRET